MPLPIAHSLIGAAITAAIISQKSFRENWKILLIGGILSNIPDFDFFFVWVLKLGANWHRSFGHSITFAVLVTLLITIINRYRHNRINIALGSALLSHCILDFLTTKESAGVEFFSPFWNERFKLGLFAPFGVSLDESWLLWLRTLTLEFIVFAPVLLIVLWIKGYFRVQTDEIGLV